MKITRSHWKHGKAHQRISKPRESGKNIFCLWDEVNHLYETWKWLEDNFITKFNEMLSLIRSHWDLHTVSLWLLATHSHSLSQRGALTKHHLPHQPEWAISTSNSHSTGHSPRRSVKGWPLAHREACFPVQLKLGASNSIRLILA